MLDGDGEILIKTIMPITEEGKVDFQEIKNKLPPLSLSETPLICVEKVWAMPGQGVCSMFTFGRLTGQVIGILESYYDQGVYEVAPQTWQRHLWGEGTENPISEKDPKRAAAVYVSRRWQDEDFRATSRSRKPHEGLVDAACIAEFARTHIKLLGA